MAFLIMMDLFVAQKLGGEMEEWDRLDSRIDHGSLGVIVGVLLLVRLLLRFKYGAPSLPVTMPQWQVWSAKAVHFLLYFFIGFLVLSGLATAINATSPVPLFGVFDITVGQADDNTFGFIREFHEFATNAMIALIGIHIVAAVYHHLIAKDNTTIRMLRFWRST